MKKISKKIIDKVFGDSCEVQKNYVISEAERIINGDKLPLKDDFAEEAFGEGVFMGTTYDPITGAEFPQYFTENEGSVDTFFIKRVWPLNSPISGGIEFLVQCYVEETDDHDVLQILSGAILDVYNAINILSQIPPERMDDFLEELRKIAPQT